MVGVICTCVILVFFIFVLASKNTFVQSNVYVFFFFRSVCVKSVVVFFGAFVGVCEFVVLFEREVVTNSYVCKKVCVETRNVEVREKSCCCGVDGCTCVRARCSHSTIFALWCASLVLQR